MVHVAQAYQFYEQDYYTPSDDGFQVFDTSFGKIGIVVCFDRHYPESIRTEALMGADLILIPTVNTKSEPSEMFEWELRVQHFKTVLWLPCATESDVRERWTSPGSRSWWMPMEMWSQKQEIRNRSYMRILTWLNRGRSDAADHIPILEERNGICNNDNIFLDFMR